MIKIFRNSFTFKNIYSLRNTRLTLILLYFIIISFLVSFPLNYQILEGDGFKGLSTFTYDLRGNSSDWFIKDLPNDGSISKFGLTIPQEAEYKFTTTTANGEFTLLINPSKKVDGLTNTIVLDDKETIYFNSNGKQLVGSYSRVVEEIKFSDLKTVTYNEAAIIFFDIVDDSFNEYAVIYSILSNTAIQFLMNFILVFILAGIMLLIKVNYKKITTFKQNLSLVVVSMTIPSLISFVISLFKIIELNSFSVVIFQFLTPIIAIFAIYRGGAHKEESIKYS